MTTGSADCPWSCTTSTFRLSSSGPLPATRVSANASRPTAWQSGSRASGSISMAIPIAPSASQRRTARSPSQTTCGVIENERICGPPQAQLGRKLRRIHAALRVRHETIRNLRHNLEECETLPAVEHGARERPLARCEFRECECQGRLKDNLRNPLGACVEHAPSLEPEF